MSSQEKLLSVAEVCELVPGTDDNATWINPGFTAVVRSISKRKTKAGKDFFPCVLADTVGSATIEVSFFQAPKFTEGDLIELAGSGLRRTEYNGKPQAAIGKSTTVAVLGKSVHHEEQVERATAGEPAVNGQPQPVHGQTVGMALKEALTLTIDGGMGCCPDKPEFWKAVHQTASDIIRVSRLLEAGKLAPSVSARLNPPPAPQPAPTAQPASKKPQAGPDGQAFNHSGTPDEDVPF